MVALYLEAIRKEVEVFKALGLSEKKIAERIKRKFQSGQYRSQTTNWQAIAKIVLDNQGRIK